MHIVYLVGSLEPGGAEIQKVRHLIELKKAGHKVLCILPNGVGKPEGNMLEWVRSEGIPISDLYAQDLLSPKDRIEAMTKFFAWQTPKIDVVHGSGYPASLEGILAAYAAQIPVRVLSWESTGFERDEFMIDWWIEYAGTSLATHIVANSEAGKTAVAGFLGATPDRIHYIPNALMQIPPPNDAALRQKSRDYWKLKPDDIAVGYLANFKEDGLKNQELLIRAAAEVLKTHPEAIFILPGYRTKYMDTCIALAKELGISHRVILPGRIDDVNLVRGWDIGVNVSHTEGLSSSIQEQMVYGEMPMIATNVGGNPELVKNGQTGYLIEDDDLENLVIGLRMLIETPDLRAKMGKKGREDIISRYSWQDVVYPAWMKLYEEGLKAK